MNDLDHKNIELFRYYISRDMHCIEEKIEKENSELIGYFIASLVDFFIVTLFTDTLNDKSLFCKSLIIIGLIIIFVITYKCVNWVRYKIRIHRNAAGRDSDTPEEIIKVVDEFDNIATDGLLICMYYKQKFESEHNEKLKRFYFSECFHYLNKSCAVFRQVAQNKDYYISTVDAQLISKYRIDNFLDIAVDILDFVKKNPGIIIDNDFKIQLKNLEGDVEHWKK